jgi:hypothetical protein
MNASTLYKKTVEQAPTQTFYGLERKKVNKPNIEELIINHPSNPVMAKSEKNDSSTGYRISGDAQYVLEQRYTSKTEGKIYGLRVPNVINKSENIHMQGYLSEIGNAGLSQYPQWFTSGMFKDLQEGEKIENQL